MKRLLDATTRVLNVLCGARACSAASFPRAVALGIWWSILLAIVLATAGRATKFIYVDF